jgi:hypothetical protein
MSHDNLYTLYRAIEPVEGVEGSVGKPALFGCRTNRQQDTGENDHELGLGSDRR